MEVVDTLVSRSAAQPITPGELTGLLPSRPVLATSEQDWDGVVLQHYRHPPSTIDLAGLRDHMMIVHLKGPVLVEEGREGRGPERRWTDRGQVSVTPAGRPVVRVLKGRPDVLLIQLAQRLVSDAAAELFDRDPATLTLVPCLALPDDTADRLGRLLEAEASLSAPGTRLMAEMLGRALAVHLLRRHSNAAPPPPRPAASLPAGRLARVVEQMHEQVSEPLSLVQLASSSGLSPSHFSRAFREATGEPPHRFLVRVRLEKARDLLEHTGLPVTAIALRCGFEQPAHFSTAFSKAVGMSPRAWRLARRS